MSEKRKRNLFDVFREKAEEFLDQAQENTDPVISEKNQKKKKEISKSVEKKRKRNLFDVILGSEENNHKQQKDKEVQEGPMQGPMTEEESWEDLSPNERAEKVRQKEERKRSDREENRRNKDKARRKEDEKERREFEKKRRKKEEQRRVEDQEDRRQEEEYRRRRTNSEYDDYFEEDLGDDDYRDEDGMKRLKERLKQIRTQTKEKHKIIQERQKTRHQRIIDRFKENGKLSRYSKNKGKGKGKHKGKGHGRRRWKHDD